MPPHFGFVGTLNLGLGAFLAVGNILFRLLDIPPCGIVGMPLFSISS